MIFLSAQEPTAHLFVPHKSINMKKILFLLALFATVFSSNTFAQDSLNRSSVPQVLTQYYNIKDALVAGKSTDARACAEQFLKLVNAIDYKVITESNINALLKDASAISDTKDIKVQREHFATLSNNMAVLAASVKFTTDPVYQAYCPMKKATWLSKDKTIRNPYYGSSMLTCGKVVATIQ